MKRAFLALIVLALLAALGFGIRAFVRVSDTKAALLTPAMNVHREFSNALGPRIYRALNAHAVSGGEKMVALTFDDGPYPVFTPLLLDELGDLHVHATFFLIGRDAQEWPSLARRIVAAGDEIGDHTYSHPDLDHETAEQVRDEILRGRDVLWSLTRDPSVDWLMRPPHGRFNEATLRVAQNLHYHVVLWTDDSGDWRTLTPQQIVEHVERFATQPEIVLFHSGKLSTIQALPAIVNRFRTDGYEFVTVSDLIRSAGPRAINHPLHRAL